MREAAPARGPERQAHFLVGPTASGKSAVAQHIAESRGWAVLSADSMLVYAGMDVGTDKPGVDERATVPYYGVDLAAPDEDFSVGRYLACVRRQLPAAAGVTVPLLVAGGTGLYVSSLVRGLESLPAPAPGCRAALEARLAGEGLPALQEELRRRAPALYTALKDPGNPRRVTRALELCEAGLTAPPAGWTVSETDVPLIGLKLAPDALNRRIEARAASMFAGGLLDEVQGLLDRYGDLSATAGKAIGYAEAMAVLAGTCSRREAIEQTARRTRRLAKRQRTWFAHREQVRWVEVAEDMGVAEMAERVEREWEQNGPTGMSF